jgi:hypothetical protein
MVFDLTNKTKDSLESLILEEYKNGCPFLIKVCKGRAISKLRVETIAPCETFSIQKKER